MTGWIKYRWFEVSSQNLYVYRLMLKCELISLKTTPFSFISIESHSVLFFVRRKSISSGRQLIYFSETD